MGPPVRRSAAGTLTALLLVGMATALAGALPSAVGAQTPFEPKGELGPTFEMYSFGDGDAVGIESLSLFTVPLTGEARVARRVRVRLTGRYARAALSGADGRTVTLSGPTDTDLRIEVPVGGDVAVLTGLVAIPTGSPTHDVDEAAIAGAVAADLLPFRITNWGTGGGAGASLAVARPLGSFGVGLSAGYVVAGDFEPREGEEVRYEPGDILRINGVLDRSLGDSKASLRLSYQNFSEDALGGANLFRAGNRLEALGTVSFPVARRSSGLLYGGVLHREQGSFLTDPRTAPSQNLLLLGGGLQVPYRGGTVTPAARLRVFRSDDGQGDGFTTELRASGRWAMGGVTWGPVVGFRFGSVEVLEGESSGLVGAELGLSLRFGDVGAPGGP